MPRRPLPRDGPPVMDWDKLRIFHAVAEAGSFTHAGESLNLSQSAVSRQISALEESLNVSLFHRHARGLILTEQGELLYRTAHEVFAKLAMAEAQLSESKDRPKGQLKVTTTVALGSTWLTPRMGEFLDVYPDVTVDLLLDDRELDLSMREADVAIRMAPPRQPELIQRHLMTVHLNIYAAPAYIKRYGLPKTVEELDNHKVIVYGEATRPPVPDTNILMRLGAKGDERRRPSLTVNNVYAIQRAAEAGLGLAALPEFMVQGSSNLVRVLPEVEGPRIDAYFVYPEELRNSKRIQVFRDFLLRKVAETER
jgi:DNA-binding transcriptional LysR family regulator